MLDSININNNNRCNDIIITNDNINIYSIYNANNIYINKLYRKLENLKKRLELLTQGPAPVRAQVYDSIHSTLVIRSTTALYQEIIDVLSEIRSVNEDRNDLIRQQKELENTINDIARMQPSNLELKVFIYHHIKNIPLINLSNKLYYFNESGKKIYYDYGYLRNINANINKKMLECDN